MTDFCVTGDEEAAAAPARTRDSGSASANELAASANKKRGWFRNRAATRKEQGREVPGHKSAPRRRGVPLVIPGAFFFFPVLFPLQVRARLFRLISE